MFKIEDKEYEVTAGDVVHIPKNVPHTKKCKGDEDLEALLFTPVPGAAEKEYCD